MNIHNIDHLTVLAASMNLTPQQLQAHLMNLGHALVQHNVKTRGLPSTASAYAMQLQKQTQFLEQACHDASDMPGSFPSAWLIDKRTVVLDSSGITTPLSA